jgi:elongation factor G
MTGGRGLFTMEFDHYEVVPTHIAADVIAARLKDLQEKKED